MDITEHIMMLLSNFIITAFLLIIAKYIFCERFFKNKKSWIIFGCLYSIAEFCTIFLQGDRGEVFMIIISAVAFSLLIAVTRTKRRFRGLFLIIPALGIVLSVEMIPGMLLALFINKPIQVIMDQLGIFEIIYDLIVLTIILLWMRKKYSGSNTELGSWERRILNGNGLLLLIIYGTVINVSDTLQQSEKPLLAATAFISIMIIGTSIIMTLQSSKARYYKTLAELNEHYLKAQMAHFKAYQETQTETRRIKHDMKNHMQCIKALYDQQNFQSLGEYLKELGSLLHEIDLEYHIGNDMADAILNEKFAAVKQQGIRLSIEGSMAGVDSIALIDLCTIFANAIDNAIEAVLRLNEPDKLITISVKRDKHFLFLSFTNPCNDKIDMNNNVIRTVKKDKFNHGFGIENIRIAVEKYKGNLALKISQEENRSLFCLEIILMI